MDMSKSGEQQLSSLILLIRNNERFIGLQSLGYIFNRSKFKGRPYPFNEQVRFPLKSTKETIDE